jgi:glycosyltransferase involved in cell wall biosynthesis
MILAFETTWSGVSHADGNRSRLLTILRAFPDATMAFHAEASHLREVFDPDPDALRRVTGHDIVLPRTFQGRPQIVSWLRLWLEYRIFARTFRPHRGRSCLVVLMSATSTGIVAAQSAARRFLGPGSLVQVVLHGELNAVTGWRSRNPLIRMLDYRAVLARDGVFPTRYVVLEDSIRAALLTTMPMLAPVLDVLPHPVPVLCAADACASSQRSLPRPDDPLRIALVGQATRDKGIDTFLAVATRMKSVLGDRVEFHHIGRVPRGADLARFAILDSVASHEPLTQAAFDAAIRRMHFIFLPLAASYYQLSASGALLDAVVRLKPVIISDLALSRQYFDAYGTIGYRYADPAEIDDIILAALASLSDGRYQVMQANLRKAADGRSIGASARRYRGIVLPHCPALA